MAPFATMLFDLDGTLIDSIGLIIDSYHHTMRVHDLPPRTDGEWLAGIGTPMSAQLRDWVGQPDLYSSLLATYRQYNLEHHDARVAPYEGITDVLEQLQETGVRLGLVTSKSRAGARRGLRVAGLTRFMELVVAADDVTNGKPDPEPVIVALEMLGADPASAVFVGDSVHDIVAGHAAGVTTAAALWGPFERADLEIAAPHLWLEHPGALLQL